MDFAEDDEQQAPDAGPATPQSEDGKGTPAHHKKLVAEIIKEIKSDREHHAKAFKRMRRDMQVATWGAETTWGSDNYRANISGRHIKQKTAALYAKNPRAVAERREQMDYAVWDENPQSLMMAMQTIQMAQAAAAQPPMADPAMPPQVDPATGTPVPPQPQLPPGFEQAMALVADFQQGYARKDLYTKIGKTLELLFAYFMDEQQPVDFKRGMKACVRRALTTGVGYVKLGFQREKGPRPGLVNEMADAQARLDHLRRIAEDLAEGEMDEDSAERAELELSLQSLQAEPEIVLREGLIVDYPASTKVIPDRLCKQLDGFIGASRVTLEYAYSPKQVQEIFGVDLEQGFTPYHMNEGSSRAVGANDVLDDDYQWADPDKKKGGLVCVWECFDKTSGLVYYLADGHEGFLKEPSKPDVFVETFWPVFPLTFNSVENEDELFPPSDVSLMIDMQREHNRARQGLREHRDAARPRWVSATGAWSSEEDPMVLKNLKPFEMATLNMDPQAKIGDIMQALPVPGVDPNLYETGPIFADTELVVGAGQAQFGGTSKATATEASIAANATTSADGSGIDDLDGFLSQIARASGQILQKEMSEEIVRKLIGPGAIWPQMTLAEISGEIQLKVAAGSTGKPNQAVEINNLERLMPFLLQMPNIDPMALAKEVLRRLDDRMDITSMVIANAPSIMAMNGMAQPSPADPAANPASQGAAGAQNTPAAPGGAGGSAAAFGSNQV
jgi:hypothetical protein